MSIVFTFAPPIGDFASICAKPRSQFDNNYFTYAYIFRHQGVCCILLDCTYYHEGKIYLSLFILSVFLILCSIISVFIIYLFVYFITMCMIPLRLRAAFPLHKYWELSRRGQLGYLFTKLQLGCCNQLDEKLNKLFV